MSTLNQAEAHLGAREIDRALAVYEQLEHDGCTEPDRLSGGRWMCHMIAGDYDQAWQSSDAIRDRGAPDVHRFWQGEPIDSKRVMLRCLHGYGDTVMYLRWLPLLNQRASSVTVQACPEMLPLLRSMPDAKHVISWTAHGESDRDHWDVQIESAELPYFFRATTATLPAPVKLVFPEVEMHRIRACMGERTRPRVGLVWTGSNYDAARSIPFDQFRGLMQNHSVEFWSLQAPENNHDWTHLCAERGWSARTFYTHGETANELHGAGIADMAAFASEMDLVITIDTMAAHLAGSLGLPTFLVLKREADWRWMLDRDDSPWYPTVRIFRQHTTGDWTHPLTRVCDALRDFCEELEA